MFFKEWPSIFFREWRFHAGSDLFIFSHNSGWFLQYFTMLSIGQSWYPDIRFPYILSSTLLQHQGNCMTLRPFLCGSHFLLFFSSVYSTKKKWKVKRVIVWIPATTNVILGLKLCPLVLIGIFLFLFPQNKLVKFKRSVCTFDQSMSSVHVNLRGKLPQLIRNPKVI